MPVLTSPPISDSTNRLIDRAVEDFDPELKPYVALIRSGQPSKPHQVASDMRLTIPEVLPLMVRAVEAFGRAIRSLEIDEGERKVILRWLSKPRSEGPMMSFQEILAKLDEMDAA